MIRLMQVGDCSREQSPFVRIGVGKLQLINYNVFFHSNQDSGIYIAY